MGKIKLWNMLHPDLLHHSPGARVGRDGDRYHFLQSAGGKGVLQRSLRSFRGEASAPVAGGKPPADLHGGLGYRWHGEAHRLKSDEPDEVLVFEQLRREKAK